MRALCIITCARCACLVRVSPWPTAQMLCIACAHRAAPLCTPRRHTLASAPVLLLLRLDCNKSAVCAAACCACTPGRARCC